MPRSAYTRMSLEELLAEPGRYNFTDLLADAHLNDAQLNTVELFAFGKLDNYEPSLRFIALSPTLTRKLIKIELLGLCNRYEDMEVTSAWIHDRLLAGVDVIEAESPLWRIESLIIELTQEGAIDAKIDEQNDKILFLNSHLYRDAFNPETYALRVLTESDVEDLNVEVARKNLLLWVESKVVPARENLTEGSK